MIPHKNDTQNEIISHRKCCTKRMKKQNSNITSNLIPHIDQTNRHQRNRSTTLTTILHQKSVVVRPLKLICLKNKKSNQKIEI